MLQLVGQYVSVSTTTRAGRVNAFHALVGLRAARTNSHRRQAANGENVGHRQRHEEASVAPAEESCARNGKESRHAQYAANALPIYNAYLFGYMGDDTELQHYED